MRSSGMQFRVVSEMLDNIRENNKTLQRRVNLVLGEKPKMKSELDRSRDALQTLKSQEVHFLGDEYINRIVSKNGEDIRKFAILIETCKNVEALLVELHQAVDDNKKQYRKIQKAASEAKSLLQSEYQKDRESLCKFDELEEENLSVPVATNVGPSRRPLVFSLYPL